MDRLWVDGADCDPMDLKNPVTENNIICRLCGSGNEKLIEIFGEHGIALQIAAVVATHFCFEVKK